MNPFEREDDTKKTGLRPEPLCLFCFPDDSPSVLNRRKTYINALPKREPETGRAEKAGELQAVRAKQKEEFWLRRRTEARIRRRRMKEPIRNLRSFLLTSVNNEKAAQKTVFPSLFQVLETVKDAWPSPSSRKLSLLRLEDQKSEKDQNVIQGQKKMIDQQINVAFTSQLLNRRFSMPEELMRRYSLSKDKTSEESETNKTTVAISSSSSSSSSSSAIEREETVRMNDAGRKEEREEPPKKADACQQTGDGDEECRRKEDEGSSVSKRATQNEYYDQGRRIIKVKAAEKGSHAGACTCRSSTTASAKEESDDGASSESIPSSSPTQLPKRESSSENLSSESDYVRCTCAELTSSKETSTDLFHSGKSTLSQTVSDKSSSTQDSTVSINSVSTRGSTVTDNSISTTPEIERTSAKETTTSPDYSPRTPRSHANRKNRRRDHKRTCPRYDLAKHSKNDLSVGCKRQCPVHRPEDPVATTSCGTNTEEQAKPEVAAPDEGAAGNEPATSTRTTQQLQQQQQQQLERYKWAKLSQEELYMMQQLRHKKFIENQRRFSIPLPAEPETESIGACETGSSYKETEHLDKPMMIPRYSALPRTLSMLVNTSSGETSVHSDSDNQSLADSLEDQPVTHIHKLYFDTKKESKPVRGDASVLEDTKFKHRQPRGRAFFVSIKDPFGEDELLESIDKIPQPPEKIKNQIFQRHLDICAKHQHLHQPKPEKRGKEEKKRKTKETDVPARGKKEGQEQPKKPGQKKQEEGKSEAKSKPKETKDTRGEPKANPKRKREAKDRKGLSGSKIPVLVSSRSTSSSPERDFDVKERPARPKARLRREKETKVGIGEGKGDEAPPTIETTQILKINHAGRDANLQKPQAIIHPSQVPETVEKDYLTIPPLMSGPRVPHGRQVLLAQVRRSPIGKFRQRFEVIPEEKSSSLSSAEEKNAGGSLPKFADASTSPLLDENIQFQKYDAKDVPNLIVAKITNKQLEGLPYLRSDENQKIIFFSSKGQNSNSSKGRDALIAMNRDDFNRLAKGWMNFYKLNDNPDFSENEDIGKGNKTDKPPPEGGGNKVKMSKNDKINRQEDENRQENLENPGKIKTENLGREKSMREPPELHKPNDKCLKVGETKRQLKDRNEHVKMLNGPELNEEIRFHSSNTILRTAKEVPAGHSERGGRRQSSLPDLRTPGRRSCEVHKRPQDEDTDSDSTDYLEPPSPRVPPLPLADFPSDATISSSDGELEDSKPQPLPQYFKVKKRGTSNRRPSLRETSRFGKKKNSGWSVTVAGTVELSRSAPDLEMRLSFPVKGGPPLVSQSDSGFAEDSNYSKLSESLQDLDFYTPKDQNSGSGNQKWMVTVENPQKESLRELGKASKNSSHLLLPELESSQKRKTKKVLKDSQTEEKVKRIIEKKMRAIWPEVGKVIKKEFLSQSGRWVTELGEDITENFCLFIAGSAVSLERKQKPPTMTERDVTRRYTNRDKSGP